MRAVTAAAGNPLRASVAGGIAGGAGEAAAQGKSGGTAGAGEIFRP